MTTKLDRPVRREITIGEVAYTLTIDAQGFKIVQKGHRKGIEKTWAEQLGGDHDKGGGGPSS